MKVISAREREVKAYSKRLSVEVEGKVYGVFLYWDEQDGYHTTWYEGSKWVKEPKAIQDKAEEEDTSVGYLLEKMEEMANV
jgi:hypothetical protein